MTRISTVIAPAASTAPAVVRRTPNQAMSPAQHPSRAGTPAGGTAPGARAGIQVRSSAMLLLNENLARARMREMEQNAEELRRAQRFVAARRWQRRAAHANRRARQAQNAVW